MKNKYFSLGRWSFSSADVVLFLDVGAIYMMCSICENSKIYIKDAHFYPRILYLNKCF